MLQQVFTGTPDFGNRTPKQSKTAGLDMAEWRTTNIWGRGWGYDDDTGTRGREGGRENSSRVMLVSRKRANWPHDQNKTCLPSSQRQRQAALACTLTEAGRLLKGIRDLKKKVIKQNELRVYEAERGARTTKINGVFFFTEHIITE